MQLTMVRSAIMTFRPANMKKIIYMLKMKTEISIVHHGILLT